MKVNSNSYLGFKFCSLENPAFSCRFFVFECQVSLRRRIRTEDFEIWMGRGSLFWSKEKGSAFMYWVLQISNQILCIFFFKLLGFRNINSEFLFFQTQKLNTIILRNILSLFYDLMLSTIQKNNNNNHMKLESKFKE